MRFVIAPDWVMKLKDDDVLSSKQVLDIYGYDICSRSASVYIKHGLLPNPDRCKQQGKRRLLFWSVKHIKNNLKLPTEIRL